MATIGRYEIIGHLGRGGMGAVFRAYDPKLGREVAIKTILLDEAQDTARADLRERFKIEAQAAAGLSHPHIVTVHDYDEENGVAYLVMELIIGDNVKQLAALGQLPTQEVVRILLSTATALDYAHDHGIFHRDVKPVNLMVRHDKFVKLTDFGIAKIRDITGLTRTGLLVGTLPYMAPELLEGHPFRPQSDQYSLGIVAFELLTGTTPFEGPAPATLMRSILNNTPPSICQLRPILPRECDWSFARVLAKDSAARYLSCVDFVQSLQDAFATQLATDAPLQREKPTIPAKMPPEPLRNNSQDLSGEQDLFSGRKLVDKEVSFCIEAIKDINGYLVLKFGFQQETSGSILVDGHRVKIFEGPDYGNSYYNYSGRLASGKHQLTIVVDAPSTLVYLHGFNGVRLCS